MKLTLLNDIIKYIEEIELIFDNTNGNCRNLKELIDDGEMPDCYHELIKIRERSNSEFKNLQP